MRRALPAALLLLLAGCFASIPGPDPVSPVRLLLINDVYVADTLADGMGGLARVAATRRRLEEVGPTLLIASGDLLSPSVLSKYYRGKQMVEALNAAGVRYATFGNHEFELDRDTLVARIAESKFTWLSANCTDANGQPFPGVKAWDTVTVATHKVGLFGVTLQGDYRRYVRCTNPDSAARAAIDSLAAQGVELIVGVTHQSLQADRALLLREPRLDLVLGGHEHEAHTENLNGRHLLKADANARSAQFVTLWASRGPEGARPAPPPRKGEPPPPKIRPVWQQAPTLLRMDRTVQPDTAVERIVRGWSDTLARRLGPDRVIGTVTAPIEGRDAVQRRAESGLGALVTDAVRLGTGADVAIVNSGTMRFDDVIPAGPLSRYTAESIFLFADETRFVTFPLTGARLRELLEHGLSRQGSGAFPQVSGVRFAFDPARPAGRRIVGELTRPDGRPIAAADRLTVAFNGFPACEQGDGYQVPEAAEACTRRAEGRRAVDLLVEHVEQRLGRRVAPPADGRMREAGASGS